MLALSSMPLRAEPLQLVWGSGAAGEAWQIDGEGRAVALSAAADLRAPLGSLWKLFVHAWLLQQPVREPAYRCSGASREEVYCCEAGASIERDQALLKSCGLYFEPRRLGIDAGDWARFWRARDMPDWLLDLPGLGPQREVPVRELLVVLARLPGQEALRETLAAALLADADRAALVALGSRLRIKTWSWHRADAPGQRIGGFAGWLADGRPVWAQGVGSSRQVLRRHAAALARRLPPALPLEGGECVDVALFARYPVVAVEQAGQAAPAGRLQGRYRVRFAAGNEFDIESAGELLLSGAPGHWQLTARLQREDYVARVLEREAAASPLPAAQALAVAIRSYLLQQARREGECLHISDSSATQRVAARPASGAAREAAAFSAGLVLAGVPVRYHRDREGDNQLAWSDARARAARGEDWLHILAAAYPRGDLASWTHPRAECEPLPEAERWLRERIAVWRRELDAEIGYEASESLQVCRLPGGRPHVDRERQRIFVRGLRQQQDRLDLAHEYLHLAFSAHPRGQDEVFVEQLARRLVLE